MTFQNINIYRPNVYQPKMITVLFYAHVPWPNNKSVNIISIKLKVVQFTKQMCHWLTKLMDVGPVPACTGAIDVHLAGQVMQNYC